ncbi:hypothetical protein SLE2022_021330 [Rubroshorea leprosula]
MVRTLVIRSPFPWVLKFDQNPESLEQPAQRTIAKLAPRLQQWGRNLPMGEEPSNGVEPWSGYPKYSNCAICFTKQ